MICYSILQPPVQRMVRSGYEPSGSSGQWLSWFQNTTQYPEPSLETGLFDLKVTMLTVRPECLQYIVWRSKFFWNQQPPLWSYSCKFFSQDKHHNLIKETLPAVQLIQSLICVLVELGWNVPMGHNSGSSLFPTQYVPGLHGTSCELDAPGGQ